MNIVMAVYAVLGGATVLCLGSERAEQFISGIFTLMGVSVLIHAWWSRRRYLLNGGGELAGHREKAAEFMRRASPKVAMSLGLLMLVLLGFLLFHGRTGFKVIFAGFVILHCLGSVFTWRRLLRLESTNAKSSLTSVPPAHRSF